MAKMLIHLFRSLSFLLYSYCTGLMFNNVSVEGSTEEEFHRETNSTVCVCVSVCLCMFMSVCVSVSVCLCPSFLVYNDSPHFVSPAQTLISRSVLLKWGFPNITEHWPWFNIHNILPTQPWWMVTEPPSPWWNMCLCLVWRQLATSRWSWLLVNESDQRISQPDRWNSSQYSSHCGSQDRQGSVLLKEDYSASSVACHSAILTFKSKLAC